MDKRIFRKIPKVVLETDNLNKIGQDFSQFWVTYLWGNMHTGVHVYPWAYKHTDKDQEGRTD